MARFRERDTEEIAKKARLDSSYPAVIKQLRDVEQELLTLMFQSMPEDEVTPMDDVDDSVNPFRKRRYEELSAKRQELQARVDNVEQRYAAALKRKRPRQ